MATMRNGAIVAALALSLLALPCFAAVAPCPECAKLAAELDAAKQQQAELEKTIERTKGQLAENGKSKADVERQLSAIDADIDRQGETSVSTDDSGATLRSQYDLATGERVTTRTPPGGPTTEVGREPSKWLKDLLAEKAKLEAQNEELEAKQKQLESEQAAAEKALPAARRRVTDLEQQLADCLKKPCGPTAQAPQQAVALIVERAQMMEFRVPPGGDAHAITESLPGATLFPIPSGAGGGFQVAVLVPSDVAAAAALKAKLDALAAQGLITDLMITPCRKFLPEATGGAGTSGTTVAPAARTAQIIKGTARTGTGVELGQAVVVLVPPPVEPPPDQPPGEEQQPGGGIDTPIPWLPGIDDQPPALGVPDPNGDFVIIVPDGYRGPYVLMLAPICNCTTTTQTYTGGTETVPVQNETLSTPPPETPVSTTPEETKKPEYCLCGPDITKALTAAINRAQQRIDALPDDEKGFYDGFEFLYNNADAFDAPVAPLTDPTLDPATLLDPKGAWLCPSGDCARMGQVPFTLAGYCLPKHMSNEILASFVASGVGVPQQVFSAGANVKEVLNYGSLEGNAPAIAYTIGYELQSNLEDMGSLSQQQVEKIVKDVLEASVFGYFQNYAAIKDEYPTLEKCDLCPYDFEAHFSKDFTNKPWKLHDGTRVGGGAAAPTSAPPQNPVKPPLKPGAKPPRECDGGSSGTTTGSTTRGQGCAAPVGTGTGGTSTAPQPTTPTPAQPASTDPADEDWGGKQNGEVVDCCELLKNVLAEIEATPFGQSPRGAGIIATVKGYLCGDITFAITKDGIFLKHGPPLPATEDASGDGDLVGPGEARYERTLRPGFVHSEEIYIGIDRSTRGIAAASTHPGDFYICDEDGELCVISKADLVHNLIHEGLHATLQGKYNVDGKACLEEEIDAFNAGNEAAAAMGVPLSTDRPQKGGYDAASNPDYQTYTGE